MTNRFDRSTIEFYDREADIYARRSKQADTARLNAFIAKVGSGARVLELGAGAGLDAAHMMAAGLDVDATDASEGLARIAAGRIGAPVRLMRFDELHAAEVYHGVWANACLHHAPDEELNDATARIWRALKPGGWLFASLKSGEGGARDSLGRYYNFPTRERLEAAFAAAGDWRVLDMQTTLGGGYDGVERTWFNCWAQKPE